MYKPVMTMENDPRPIRELSTTRDVAMSYLVVGHAGVTQIRPYLENEDMLWFAIYQGDWLSHRVNAAQVEYVWYGEAPEDTKEKGAQ